MGGLRCGENDFNYSLWQKEKMNAIIAMHHHTAQQGVSNYAYVFYFYFHFLFFREYVPCTKGKVGILEIWSK